MPTVFLGLGSNIEPLQNLRMAVSELRSRFGEVRLSSVYQSKPLGFQGEDFLNLVARISTDLTPLAVCQFIDEIHDMSGRERGCAKLISRALDIDLLLYDRLIQKEPPVRVPRADVLEYGFVLQPLAEIAEDYVHPQTGRSIADHLRDFDLSRHRLTRKDVIL